MRPRPCRILPLLLPALLAGCGPDDLSAPEALDDEAITSEEEGKADSYSATSTYLLARPDHRKCMFPLCGGFFLRRANRATVKCGDGKWAAECYVAEVDLAKLKLGTAREDEVRIGLDEERGILRGTIAKTTMAGQTVARLVAKEAWLAPVATPLPPSDILHRGTPSGIVCVKAPCPTIHIAKLNSTIAANIAEPSLAAVPGSAKELAAAAWELSHLALILAGHPAGPTLEVSQIYRRILPVP